MYFIFFLACIVTCSVAADSESDETKYIDLLPEHEKKAFLDKIARRIFEEVQAKDGKNETSGEISEAKLDAQNEYIAKLLQEESKNLRRTEKNKLEDKDTQSSDISKEKENKSSSNKDDKIDLTLREGKRNKRNKSKETSEEREKNTETTKIPENISVEIAVKNKNEPKSKEVKTEVKSDSSEKIPVKVVYDDTSTKIEDTTKAALRTEYNTSTETNKSHTEISEFSPEESKDTDSIEPSKVESTTVVEHETTRAVTEKSGVKTGMTERIYEPIQSEDTSSDNENKSQIDSNAKSSNESSSAEKTQEDTTVAKPNVIHAETNATESLKDEVSNTTQVEQPTVQTPVLRTGKENGSKSVDNKNDNDPTRRNYEVLTTTSKANSEETTSKDSNDNFKTTSDSKVFETTTGKKESLRHGFFENSAETQIEDSKLFDEIQSRYNKDKVQHYEVYEISPDNVKPVVKQARKLKRIESNLPQQKDHPYYVPVYNYAPNNAYYRQSPDVRPLLKQEKKFKPVGRNPHAQGHPHYIPIYNYAPNNAFFDPYNRLGPNYGDENHEKRYEEQAIVQTKKHIRGKQKTKVAKKERLNKKVKIQFDLSKYVKPVKIKQQSFTDYHFQDYYDMNFYFGQDGARKKQQVSEHYRYQESKSEEKPNHIIFPNSDESSHPRNRSPYKDHLTAVRQILYENKIFGHIPERSTTTIPRNTKTTVTETDLESDSLSTTEQPEEDRVGKSRGYPAFGLYDWYTRSKPDNYDQSSRENDNQQKLKDPYNNPITFDYYFGTDEAQRSTSDLIIKNSEETNEDAKEKRYLFGSSDPADLLPTLEKLQSFKVERTSEDLDHYFKVLKDMIDGNSRALNQYDWLRTTVDVRSALKKLSDLSQRIKSNASIHPADMELFKYILYLHKTTRSSLRENGNDEDSLIPAVMVKRGLLPRIKHPSHKLITMKGKMNRVWLRKVSANSAFRKDLSDFDDFLNDLGSGMYELHNAIKHIALITKYNNQRWYINLKELYLSKATKKDLLGLLLHFSTSRLITLLELSSNNGLESGFFEYMEKNMDEVRQAKEEFLFVMRILDNFNEYY